MTQTILRNSAECVHCGLQIESTHRHDFVTHYCDVEPMTRGGEITFNFAVDGGKAYLRRVGEFNEFRDTSQFTTQEPI